jgi:hypothetical protein
VSLAGYEGGTNLRWAFGSDGAATAEGWYVDDVRIYTNPPSGIADGWYVDDVRIYTNPPSGIADGMPPVARWRRAATITDSRPATRH